METSSLTSSPSTASSTSGSADASPDQTQRSHHQGLVAEHRLPHAVRDRLVLLEQAQLLLRLRPHRLNTHTHTHTHIRIRYNTPSLTCFTRLISSVRQMERKLFICLHFIYLCL